MIHELFTYEDDDRIVLERNVITDDETRYLAVTGCLTLGGKIWYRRKRFDSRLQAEPNLQPGEIIVESRLAVFILTPDQKVVQPVCQALVTPGPVLRKSAP